MSLPVSGGIEAGVMEGRKCIIPEILWLTLATVVAAQCHEAKVRKR